MRRQLFERIILNVAIGNIDHHARNHATFWDGQELTLSPAYDLCPQFQIDAIKDASSAQLLVRASDLEPVISYGLPRYGR